MKEFLGCCIFIASQYSRGAPITCIIRRYFYIDEGKFITGYEIKSNLDDATGALAAI